ncbi:hypothetical protein BDZ97DRAFT_426608 [Flammula alnicola]|nr:hypothetical protein BDZ97DRAFT_426608 [Flammula alnicola]
MFLLLQILQVLKKAPSIHPLCRGQYTSRVAITLFSARNLQRASILDHRSTLEEDSAPPNYEPCRRSRKRYTIRACPTLSVQIAPSRISLLGTVSEGDQPLIIKQHRPRSTCFVQFPNRAMVQDRGVASTFFVGRHLTLPCNVTGVTVTFEEAEAPEP